MRISLTESDRNIGLSWTFGEYGDDHKLNSLSFWEMCFDEFWIQNWTAFLEALSFMKVKVSKFLKK